MDCIYYSVMAYRNGKHAGIIQSVSNFKCKKRIFVDIMKLKGSDDNVNVEMKSSSYPVERFFGAYLYVVLPSPMQIDDTITLEIDGREIDIEVETVPDVYENYLRNRGDQT